MRSLADVRSLCVLLLAALAARASAGVLVVDPSGGGQHTTISAAVAAASEGDVLLVGSGFYLGFAIDGKSLTIVADQSAIVTVSGQVAVRNLAASQRVVLAGLDVLHPVLGSSSVDPQVGAALVVSACQGAVRAQDCSFEGATATASSCFSTSRRGRHGATVQSSPSVALERCVLRGGRGGGHVSQCWCGTDGAVGGDGLACFASKLAFYDGIAQGGDGGMGAEQGGGGGAGATVADGLGIVASNTSFLGGDGGSADAGPSDPSGLCVTAYGGDGGHGLRVSSGAAQHVGGILAGGEGGAPPFGPRGEDGLPTVGPNVFALEGPPRVLVAPHVAREGASYPLRFEGVPGDRVYLRISRETGFLHLNPWKGVLLTQDPRPAFVLVVGTIPASGVLVVNGTAPDVPAALEATTYFLQAQFRSASGGTWLGSFAALTDLDAAF